MSKLKITGLSTAQAEESKLTHGRDNELSQRETDSFWTIFKNSFKDFWVRVLLGAVVVKIVLGFIDPSHAEYHDIVALLIAVAMTTGFSSNSEYSQAKEFAALQSTASKSNVAVLRDGELTELLIDRLVIGDVVKLRAGDQVPADGYLLSGEIKVDQAALNGESDPARKIPLGDNPMPAPDDTFNEFIMLRGSFVVEGEAYMYVSEVGDMTMIGQINTSLQEDGKKAPSEEKLDRLGIQIGKFGMSSSAAYILIMAALYFVVGITSPALTFWLDAIMYAVTIIIMAVPEGLPMMTTMVSSMNAKRLLKQDVLVRNTSSIETAGYMDLLYSDKTGTITKGAMSTVVVVLGDGSVVEVTSEQFDQLPADFKTLLMNGVGLNNDAFIVDGHGTGANPTDNALMTFLYEKGLMSFDRDTIDSKELFDSEKKFASVTVGGDTYIKGAPEKTLDSVTRFYTTDGTATFERSAFDQACLAQAERSMRIISVIHRDANGVETLIAGVGLRDDVRPGMKETLASAARAGVQVVMVTGDRKETAIAIAKDAGLYTSETDVVLTHDELAALTDDQVKELLPNLRVVARALPMDKKRLVKIGQEMGRVVGMTGDGVNDSAALKAADVGFSLGDGTQAAQNASDIVLVNNSLDSIITSILYGRTMTKTVQKFIIFQLTVNVTTIAMSLLSPILGFGEPFTVTQVLWINLIMDTLAALAYGLEPALRRYLDAAPISRASDILTNYMKSAIGTSALFATTVATLIMTRVINVGLSDDAAVRTFMFTFFIYTILVNGFNTRSEGFNLLENIGENKRFLYIMGGIAAAQSVIIQVGGKFFGTVPMDLTHFAMAFGLALLVIPVDMLRKVIVNRK